MLLISNRFLYSLVHGQFELRPNFDFKCHKQQNEKNEKNEGKARGWGKNDEWIEDDYYLVFSIFVS